MSGKPAEASASSQHALTSVNDPNQKARTPVKLTNFAGSCCLPITGPQRYSQETHRCYIPLLSDRINPKHQPFYKVCYDLNGPPAEVQNFRSVIPGNARAFAQRNQMQPGEFSLCPLSLIASPQFPFQRPPVICRPLPAQIPILYPNTQQPLIEFAHDILSKEGTKPGKSLSPERTGTIPIRRNRSRSSHSSASSSHQHGVQSKKTTRDMFFHNFAAKESENTNEILQTMDPDKSVIKHEVQSVNTDKTNITQPTTKRTEQTEDPLLGHSKLNFPETDNELSSDGRTSNSNSHVQTESVNPSSQQQQPLTHRDNNVETPKPSPTIKGRTSEPFQIQMDESLAKTHAFRTDIEPDIKKESAKVLKSNEEIKRKISSSITPRVAQGGLVSSTPKDRMPVEGYVQQIGHHAEANIDNVKSMRNKRFSSRKNIGHRYINITEREIPDHIHEYAMLGLRFTPSKSNGTGNESGGVVADDSKSKRRSQYDLPSNSVPTGKSPKFEPRYADDTRGSKTFLAPSIFPSSAQNPNSSKDVAVSTTNNNEPQEASVFAMNTSNRERSASAKPTAVGSVTSQFSAKPDLTLQIQLVTSLGQIHKVLNSTDEDNELEVDRNSKTFEVEVEQTATAVDTPLDNSLQIRTSSSNNANSTQMKAEALEEYSESSEKVLMVKLYQIHKQVEGNDKLHQEFTALRATKSQLGILENLRIISSVDHEMQPELAKYLLSRIILRPDQIAMLKTIEKSASACLRLPEGSQLLSLPEATVVKENANVSSVIQQPVNTSLLGQSHLLSSSKNGIHLEMLRSLAETDPLNSGLVQHRAEITEATNYPSDRQDVHSPASSRVLATGRGPNFTFSVETSSAINANKIQTMKQQLPTEEDGAITDTETHELVGTAQRLLESVATRLSSAPQRSNPQSVVRQKTKGNYNACCPEERHSCSSDRVKDAIRNPPKCLVMALNNIERIINSYRLGCAPNSERMCFSPHPYRNIYLAPKRPVLRTKGAAEQRSNERMSRRRESSRSRTTVLSKNNEQADKHAETPNPVLTQGSTPDQLLPFRQLRANPQLHQLLNVQPKHSWERLGSSVIRSADSNNAVTGKEETTRLNLGPLNDPGFTPPSNLVLRSPKAKYENGEDRKPEKGRSAVWDPKSFNEIGRIGENSVVPDSNTMGQWMSVNPVAKETDSLQRKSSDIQANDNVLPQQLDAVTPAAIFNGIRVPEISSDFSNGRASDEGVLLKHRKSNIPPVPVKVQKFEAQNKRTSNNLSENRGQKRGSIGAKKSIDLGKTSKKKA